MKHNFLSLCGFTRVAFTAFVFFFSATASATNPVGATPGSFAVSPTGASTYTIPIAVPPGTAGMEPKLALSYNSQGGNGLLGMGWSLSGLSAITRCPQTVAQDGVKGSVNFDVNDRFCLDGQRLVLVAGVYGRSGAEYRTEIDSFSRIFSYGIAGGVVSNGPQYFQVWTKSGQVIEFGNTTDSSIEAQGKTSVMVWAVNKIADTIGNYLTVTYTEDNANGQYYPARIDYTGNTNTGTPTYNSVQFTSAPRPDMTPLYQAGSLIRNTTLLSNIKTYSGTTLIRDYQLNYENGSTITRSRLKTLTECAGDGVCLPPTAMTYQTNGLTFGPATVTSADTAFTDYTFYSGDFNGDGIMDVMYMDTSLSNKGKSWYIFLGNSNGYFSSPIPTTLARTFVGFELKLGDFNGDGKTDFMWVSDDTYPGGVSKGKYRFVIFSNGDGSFTVGPEDDYLGTYFAGYNLEVGDFNGDGKTDILYISNSSGYGNGKFMYVFLGNGNGTFAQPTPTGLTRTFDGFEYRLGDFNGDGKTDFMWVSDDTYPGGQSKGKYRFVIFSNGDGFFTVGPEDDYLGTYFAGFNLEVGDFNGDGKTDIMYIQTDSTNKGKSWHVFLGDGNGRFASPIPTTLTRNFVGFEYRLGDFNGDGKTDLMWVTDDSYQGGVSKGMYRFVFFSNGPGDFRAGPEDDYLGTYFAGYDLKVGDFSGDGKTDILYVSNSTSSYGNGKFMYAFLGPSAGGVTDLLTSITNGLRFTTTLAHKPITDKTVYTKGTSAVYPVMDLQAPIYVVSYVNTSNGVGGGIDTYYTYGGAKVDQSGRGFLGFAWQQALNTSTNIAGYTEYSQSFPYIGIPTKATTKLGTSQVFKQTINTLATLGPQQYTGVVFPYISQSVETANDLNGAALPTVTTNTTYDAYGNPTNILVSTGDGYSKTTVNTYDNIIDATHWFLGRLRRSTVTSTTP